MPHQSKLFPINTSRRQWMSKVGLCMVSAVVPTHLVACDDPIPDPDSQMGDPLDRDLTKMIETFEEDSIYNLLEPGEWVGIEGTHVPILTFHNEYLEVTLYSNHAMNDRHHISLHYLRDQDHNLIAAKRYETNDPFARVTFQLPEGTSEISAYSYCNLHGLWITSGTV